MLPNLALKLENKNGSSGEMYFSILFAISMGAKALIEKFLSKLE